MAKKTRIKIMLLLTAILCLLLGTVAVTEIRNKKQEKPTWADHWITIPGIGKKEVITVTAGRFQTGAELFAELERQGVETPEEESVGKLIKSKNFPMSKKPYSFNVVIITAEEAGLTKNEDQPIRHGKLIERYKDLGCRPLTPEEAVELRVQFTDQPTVHENEIVAHFTCLPSKEMKNLIKITGHKQKPFVKGIAFGMGGGRLINGYVPEIYAIPAVDHDSVFTPEIWEYDYDSGFREKIGRRYACALIEETEVLE